MKHIRVLLPILVLTIIISSCMSKLDENANVITSTNDSNLSPNILTAKAGSNRIVMSGSSVVLDGSESSDPENDPLTYSWSFYSKPVNSILTDTNILNSTTVTPSFTPDATGDYNIQLVVDDGKGHNASDVVTINATDGSMSASRTSGVAPLAVFFNSGFTSSTATERPFHDLKYTWDFGDDASSDIWAVTDATTDTSGLSKNVDSGPVAAHIFEKPGTFTVNLTIENASGDTTPDSVIITVLDPDVIYSDTKTVCISSDPTTDDFVGCPTNAQQIATNDPYEIRNHITDHMASAKRVLFHRGSTWNAPAYDTILQAEDTTGAITIGAYGTCINPDARGICENAPHFTVGRNSNFMNLHQLSNWRVQDLSVNGIQPYNSLVSAATDIESVLFNRIKINGFDTPISFNFVETNGHDQIMITNCDISNAQELGMWIGAERLVIMGNRIWKTGLGDQGEHNLRIWQAYYGVISHNILYESNKIGLKLHGPSEERISKTDDTILDNRSENIVISDNVIGNTYVLAMTVGAQNSDTDERLSEILIEKNRFLADYGNIINGDNRLTTHLSIYSSNVTIRNNVFDGSNVPSYIAAISVDQYGSPIPPTNVNIYNNTIYNDGAAMDFGMYIHDVREVDIKNNLLRLPSIAGKSLYSCVSSCGYISSGGNLPTDVAADSVFDDPTNADLLLRNFDLIPGSPALDIGVDVPVLDDFEGRVRPDSSWDVGAFELP